MVQSLEQPSKAIYRLTRLVGKEVTIHLRSLPEAAVTGILDSYDLKVEPSILVVDIDGSLRIVNFHDVSVIREIKVMG